MLSSTSSWSTGENPCLTKSGIPELTLTELCSHLLGFGFFSLHQAILPFRH